MQLLDKFLAQFFVLFLERSEVRPLVGIKEVHQVEELANIIVQWGAGHDNSVDGLQFIQFLEQ
jgi:UDP-N-acetylglucosamine transferase subunit ALG13